MRSAKIDEKVSEEWLQLGSRMAGLVNLIAERQDLIVSIYPDNRTPGTTRASAWYIPAEASVNFDSSQLLEDHVHPHSVDLYDPRGQAEHIKLMGAMVHECAHATHTVLNFPKTSNRNHVEWALLLEESRIEKKALARRPQDRVFLRAAVKDVVSGGDMNKLPESQRKRAQAARSAALLLGRIDNGVLDADEVSGLRALIVKELGEDTLERMRQVWLRAQALDDGDLEGLLACGKEYYEILCEKDEENQDQQNRQQGQSGESSGSASSTSGSGRSSSSSDSSGGDDSGTSAGSEKSDDKGEKSKDEKSDNSGKPEQDGQGQESGQGQDDDGEAFQMPCGSWTWGDVDDERTEGEDSDEDEGVGGGKDDDFTKELNKDLDKVFEDAQEEMNRVAFPKRRNRDKERAEEAREKAARARNQTTARQVFNRGKGGGGMGSGRGGVSDRKVSPSDSDRRNANQLAKELRRARHRDVHRTTVPSMTPPGRMMINQAAYRDAQRARGEQITATPWKQTRRRQVEAPPFSAAISVDVSGSMDAWQRAVSSFAWAVGKATHNQGGKVGAVAWNDDVRVIAEPGKVSKDVVVANCSGGSRGLARSLDALDGQMNLVSTEGVRVLVILSDGHIGTSGVQERIDRFRKAGVLVLWVGVPDWRGDYGGWIPDNVDHIILKSPQDFGTQVGRFMADALSKYKGEMA